MAGRYRLGTIPRSFALAQPTPRQAIVTLVELAVPRHPPLVTTPSTTAEPVRRRTVSPRATVWIPSYNHAPYLPAAIESVLTQTLRDFELLIVDDGSRDGSVAIAERYAAANPDRVTLLTHPGHANRGTSATANLAIAHSKGAFLIGLASDDLLYPDTLERQVEFLEGHPEAGCVYGYAHMVNEEGRRIADERTCGIDLTHDGRTLERLVQANSIPSMTAMFRRECIERAGPFDTTVVYSDWELFVRVAAHSEIAFMPRALAMYRVHRENVSVNVTRETNVERALAVTTVVRDKAAGVGGRLDSPRIRATLDLQMAFLRFASGHEQRAMRDVRAAFERDPSLRSEGRWLGDWLWSRLLNDLLPPSGPDFSSWFGRTATPAMSREGALTLGREVAAARRAARAIALARSGRWVAAHAAALAAVVRTPRRLGDRRLAAFLLDSIAGGLAAKTVRRAKLRLLPHR
jgi:glycosyltransferase involved in cell wall biosynthesis